MIKRSLEHEIMQALNSMPATALLGPRQVGKTTLALEIAENHRKPTIYLDLERDSHLARLDDAENYLNRCNNQLLIIDEVQRKPGIFPLLRSVIDSRIRNGERTAQFLVLGSTSRDLLRQSSETLAGRIRFLELKPLSILEIYDSFTDDFDIVKLWLRGGFPSSFQAESDELSWKWRGDFISSYVERDIPQMGVQIPSTTIRSFLSMLAWENSNQINFSRLGSSLGVSYHTIQNYISILSSAFMVRMLFPWAGNVGKRLVKSPKLYLRDSGLMHRFLRITDYDDLLGHPMIGASWEAFVIENILREISDKWAVSYYRTRSQAEIDLVLEGPRSKVLAVEIKHSLTPRVTRGFHLACDDIGATEKYVIYTGKDRYPMGNDIEAIGILEFMQLVRDLD